jgi:hypothetical protein
MDLRPLHPRGGDAVNDVPATDRVVTTKDNNPPAFDAFTMALDDAYDTAKDFLDGVAIENQGQADAVGRIVAEVKRIKRDADEARKEEKRPHDEAAKAVQTKWAPLLDRADTIIRAAQKPLTAYLNALAEEQRQAELKAREEAAQKAQEAIQAQREAEGSVEAVERAKALQKEADAAAKDAGRAGKAKAHVAGVDRAIGLRTYKVATVTDHRALLEHVMRHDPDPLKAWLEEYARKALPMQLPGVTVTTERKVA